MAPFGSFTVPSIAESEKGLGQGLLNHILGTVPHRPLREKKSVSAKRANPHDDNPPLITDDELSSAQHEVKAAVVKQMGNAIPKWLEYHSGKVTPVGAMSKTAQECDTIIMFLTCLAGVNVLRYHSLTAKQLFRKQNQDINTCFNMFWNEQGGATKDWAVVHMVFIASEFEKLSTEDQERWAAFAERTSAERKRSKDGGWTEPALLPPKEIQSLIYAATYQGAVHNAQAPNLEEEDKPMSLGDIHEGQDKSPMPLCFHEVGGQPYQLWLAAIGEFMLSCYTSKEQKAHALPRVAQPPGPLPFGWPILHVDGDDEDQSENESGTEGKKQKKKRKPSKKWACKSSATEVDKGVRTNKRRKGVHEETLTQASPGQALPSIIVGSAVRMRISGHEPLPNIMNTVAVIHPVMEDNANLIDPCLLTTGLYPGSLIPNCGPNDCPNPFLLSLPQNMFADRIIEAPPSARGSSYPAQSLPLEPPPNEEMALTTGGTKHTENWLPWFAEAHTYLGCFELGAEWEHLVDLLTQVE
ncbi:hypothetical protein EDD18DRAFT_1362382 [Armillaria luteobubalina]|uniref:Uncharacterized protein n=1 Tax=Armillaria luteobubalina TaxID=153913 RepID=A0AA39UDL1_9AGAR|nr:hypothetical protein EDD18DRAFT_1362382 [Armillaria luteobubalina]